MFKKVVISSYLASAIVDPVFAAPKHHSALEILFAIYGYAIQIYADFSGYTDIAIGIALLLGIRFPQNFDAPYTARSLQDFWRRWHMTLSRWLRDYLYIPLGGNRGSRLADLPQPHAHDGHRRPLARRGVDLRRLGRHPRRRTRGRAIGARDRRERLGLPEPAQTRGRMVVEWLITFNVVCLAWVFFRGANFTTAFDDARAPVHGLGTGPARHPAAPAHDRRDAGDPVRPGGGDASCAGAVLALPGRRAGPDPRRLLLRDQRPRAHRRGAVHLLPVLSAIVGDDSTGHPGIT